MYRICFVNSMRSWGGAEIWMLETARNLRRVGIAADIVAQPGSALHVRAVAAGVPVEAIAIRFDAAPWTLIRLANALRRRRVTAVVANLTKDLKAAGVAGRLVGVRHILASRESDFPLKSKRYYRWYFGRLATGVLVNSEATRRTILASAPWLDPRRVHLLYKGIDTARFVRRPAAPGRGVVGFVGQLIPRKGLRDLMAAWSLLDARAEAPGTLRLAGEGPMRSDIERWRRGLARPGDVSIEGFCEDVVSFYHGLDLLAMPSLSEGFGLAAAEALACGVPVVAARASSLPEIVEDGVSGVLVPPGDPAALAGALARLLADGPRADAFGRAGHRLVRERFPRNATLRRLLALTGGPDLPDKEWTI